jgi:hypothetical protein
MARNSFGGSATGEKRVIVLETLRYSATVQRSTLAVPLSKLLARLWHRLTRRMQGD